MNHVMYGHSLCMLNFVLSCQGRGCNEVTFYAVESCMKACLLYMEKVLILKTRQFRNTVFHYCTVKTGDPYRFWRLVEKRKIAKEKLRLASNIGRCNLTCILSFCVGIVFFSNGVIQIHLCINNSS